MTYDSDVESVKPVFEEDKFRKTIQNLQNVYDNSPFAVPKSKKIIIEPEDFGMLSKYEKNTLRSIANIFGMDKNKEISYETLHNIINQIGRFKTDIEKGYLLALFFPEKIKNIHQLNPFPIPTYTFIQKFSVEVKPNTKGNFLIQAVNPVLLDLSDVTKSNLWVNTHEDLDGVNVLAANTFTPIKNTLVQAGMFNTYTLYACKIAVKYHGRGDVMSGYFGASYHLTSSSSVAPDVNTCSFNYVNDSPNSVISDITDGLSAVYYPPDYSYTNFQRVNIDNTGEKLMGTSHRLNIYGSGLPPEALTGKAPAVTLTYCAIYNVIPSPQFSDLLPLDYNIEDSSLDLLDISKFVPHSGLATFKQSQSDSIEKIFSLPSNIRKEALEKLKVENHFNDNKKNILEITKPIIDNKKPTDIVFSKDFWTNQNFVNEKRINANNQLNDFFSASRYNGKI